MNYGYCTTQTDSGPNPYVAKIEQMAAQNSNFRTTVWTGCYLQMTLMCIPPCGEIGLENHAQTDQIIRVEQGNAVVRMGRCKNQMEFKQNVCKGDVIFIPAGTWHNVMNTGRNCLKVFSVYAPPNHLKGTVHHTKEDAEREE